MAIELLITNIGFTISFVVSLGLGILVFMRRPENGSGPNVVFFLSMIAFSIWQASYAIGINLHDSGSSRLAFMFNLVMLVLVVINAHLVLSVTNRVGSQKRFLTVLYAIGFCLILYFVLFPDSFLLLSEPRIYFPNFFVPGSLYALQDAFFFLVLIYFLVQMIIVYHRADYRMRNRLKYFIVAVVYAYGVGLIPEFLLYGIAIDPLPASLIGLYAIPMAYAIFKYEVIDINIIAKRALVYALGTAGITFFILFIGYANNYISSLIPGFPQWLLPLLSGLLGVVVGVFIWKKIQEVDYLKFQFVDVVTHKFRTPLTHIKWSAEVLRSETNPQGRAEAIAAIEDADVRLFEMTNSLIGLSHSDESQYKYVYASENIVDVLNETLAAIENQVRAKKIRLTLHVASNLPHVFIDRRRVQFVMQMIIENAIIYSRQGSIVEITIEQRKAFIYVAVRDTGIGISAEDMPHLFSRFFRAATAAQTHTEGLGIGLFVSRDIMKRHGGDLWAESAGAGKGSTFQLKIPVEK